MNARLTVIITVTSMIGLLSAPSLAAAGQAVDACLSGVVRIEHTFFEETERGWFQIFAKSLGTAVGPHLVLTHNHFRRRPEPGLNETLTFVECSGKVTSLAVERVRFVAIDPGTALLILPDDVDLAGAVAMGQKPVAAGALLSVHYWNDAAGAFAQRKFAVIRVGESTVTLADPDRIINPGDSGGGVFQDGVLVANINAIYIDLERGPIGQFDVALLPAEAQRQLAAGAAVSTR